eukprot:2975048-Rhodomonas_salina.1
MCRGPLRKGKRMWDTTWGDFLVRFRAVSLAPFRDLTTGPRNPEIFSDPTEIQPVHAVCGGFAFAARY